jgi:hypothetical protein
MVEPVEAPFEVLSPLRFKAELQARGWDAGSLSNRWGLTRRRLHQIIADEGRPRYYDDALRGLPVRPTLMSSLPADLSEGERALIKRLQRSGIPLRYGQSGWVPLSYPRGARRADFDKLLRRQPGLVKIELGELHLDIPESAIT